MEHGRIRASRIGFALLLAVLIALPGSVQGIPRATERTSVDPGPELRLEITNDDLSGSTFPDDLYSFGGFLMLSGKRLAVRLEERGFTDKVGKMRFDETYLTALGRFSVPSGRPLAGWQGRASLGVVRVGRGLVGEPVQNELHRWIGDELVEVDYAATNDLHPHVGLAVAGPYPGSEALEGWLEVEASLGFRTMAAAGLRRRGPEVGLFRFEGALGARWTETQLDALEPWIEKLAPTVQLTTYFRRHYRLTWSYNAYGTGDLHWHFGFVTPLRRPSAASTAD